MFPFPEIASAGLLVSMGANGSANAGSGPAETVPCVSTGLLSNDGADEDPINGSVFLSAAIAEGGT